MIQKCHNVFSQRFVDFKKWCWNIGYWLKACLKYISLVDLLLASVIFIICLISDQRLAKFAGGEILILVSFNSVWQLTICYYEVACQKGNLKLTAKSLGVYVVMTLQTRILQLENILIYKHFVRFGLGFTKYPWQQFYCFCWLHK